jgi:hypothetical protein
MAVSQRTGSVCWLLLSGLLKLKLFAKCLCRVPLAKSPTLTMSAKLLPLMNARAHTSSKYLQRGYCMIASISLTIESILCVDSDCIAGGWDSREECELSESLPLHALVLSEESSLPEDSLESSLPSSESCALLLLRPEVSDTARINH